MALVSAVIFATEPDRASAHVGPARGEPAIRAGRQTVNMLVEEWRAERAALERTVATLRKVALSRRVYVPYLQQTPRWMGAGYGLRAGMYFILRTAGNPMAMAESVRRAVAEVDPDRPVADMRTVEQYLDRQVRLAHLYVLLLGIFGIIGAVLAAIGIYGVMAYSVGERTREIGIRMALGADAGAVLALIARQALAIVAAGLALGLAGSFALTRVVKSALVGVTPTDPATYTAVSLLLALVALAACFIPGLRAVAVEPTSALRYE